MKKTLITTATAIALLATPLMNKADAAALDNNDHYKNININHYEYKINNTQDLQAWVNQVLLKYNVTLRGLHLSPEYKTVQQAKPTAPAKQDQQAKPTAPAKQDQQAKPTAPAKQDQQAKPTVPAKSEQPSKPTATAKPAPTQSTDNQKPTTTKPVQQPSTSSNQQTSNQLNAFEQQVVDLTNKERAKYNLPALKIDTELSKVARVKSNDMSTKKYFDHTSPTYGSPFDMMKQFGITYHAAGENIAMGQRTPEEVVNAWMNSAGHRANILNKDFTHIGVGYVGNGNYWTQEFIGK